MAGPPPPPSLSYETIGEAAVTYLLRDTSRIEIDAGGETIEADVSMDAVLDLQFRPTSGAVNVTATYRRLSAIATSPLGPDQTATEGAIEGPLVFDLGPDGAVTVVSAPTMETAASRFITPEAAAATWLPRVPARPVRQGETWIDTVRIDATQPDGSVVGSTVVTYTVTGDTVVGGRELLHVNLSGEDERELIAEQAGMEITQSLAGTVEGWFLWDPVLGLPWESVRNSELTGTMQVTEAPFPLSVRVTSRNELQMVEEESGG